jgi:hypothetical protein
MGRDWADYGLQIGMQVDETGSRFVQCIALNVHYL